MSQPVIIKSNRYGMNLILSEGIPFPDLLQKINEKFVESEKFFKNAKLAISFEGRALSDSEQQQILESISQNTSIDVICILEENSEKEETARNNVYTAMQSVYTNYGEFYKGTLRSGQELVKENGVIILGDVNPGAKIVSNGNIVVLGALKGTAYAGASGNEACFVAALDMNPVQIMIGNVIGRSADESILKTIKDRKKRTATPQLAIVSEGHITIEPISKSIINNL
ncbi:MAG: septum site-determining protein MinC [Lachnospiraceae bacterium]